MWDRFDRRMSLLKIWIILAAVALPGLLIRLPSNPMPWFDEGINTNTAMTLASHGVYGTASSDGYNRFDTSITSGPPLILPMAAVFKVFGPGMFQARIVSTFYALLALGMVVLTVARWWGQLTALLTTFILVSFPSIAGIGFTSLARQAMGETASLAYFMVGVLLWMAAIERDENWRRIASGGMFGLAVLAKMQSGLSILPGLMVMAVILAWGRPRRAWLEQFLPLFVAVFTVGIWMLIAFVGTPPADRLMSGDVQWSAMRLLIIPGVLSRTTSRGLLAIGLVMAVSLLVTMPAWRRTLTGSRTGSAVDHGRALLGMVVAFDLVWVLGLSIGWPRYAYLGLMLSIILLASAVVAAVSTWWSGGPGEEKSGLRGLARAGSGVLVIAVLLTPTIHALGGRAHDPGALMAAYIDAKVPRGVVIESWEWQIDAISAHRMFRHPDHMTMLKAISAQFIVGADSDLNYPIEEPEPTYLLVGPFGAWTGIYAGWLGSGGYQEIHREGPYILYAAKDRCLSLSVPIPALPWDRGAS
jgi:4-amino-4-deoxy-L-arabinose transferase-like glycosyltransferase